MDNVKYNQNCIACKDTQTYEKLQEWAKTTEWEISDLNEFFKLANIHLPITLKYMKNIQKFSNVDDEYEHIYISLSYNLISPVSKLTIEYENNTVKTYVIKSKSCVSSYKDAFTLSYYKLKDHNDDNQVETIIKNNSYTKILRKNDGYLYTISFKSLESNETHVLKYIEKYLNHEECCYTFDSYLLDIDEYVSSPFIMRRLIMDDLSLTDEMLKSLNIYVEVSLNDRVISKIVLFQNIITLLKYSDSSYSFTIYNIGRIEIDSEKNSLNMVIENLDNIETEYLSFENDFIKFKYDLKPFKKLITNMKRKNWFTLQDL